MTGAETERDIQRKVITLYRLAGASVQSLSQGYRPGGKRHGTTRQSKGLGDLYILHPAVGGFWHETKRPGARQTPEQVDFQRRCVEAGVSYVLGGTREALDFLVKRGLWKLPA